MAWQKTDNLLRKRLNQHGLGELVEAGTICAHAQSLYPGMFEAVSVKNDVLHLKLVKKNQLELLMVQGKLLEDLAAYCKAKNLRPIARIRLTIVPS